MIVFQGWMGRDCNDICLHGTQFNNSGVCTCDSCYTGLGCNAECNNHGSCVDGGCECDAAWWGENCTIRGCPGEGALV